MSQVIWTRYNQLSEGGSADALTLSALALSPPPLKVAVDLGCGIGNDVETLLYAGYLVHAFDSNQTAIERCQQRFSNEAVTLSLCRFEEFIYPTAGLVVANNSLFFADAQQFEQTWLKIAESIVPGGYFAGNFLGYEDDWLIHGSPHSLCPVSESELRTKFADFELVSFEEQREYAKTRLGKPKFWHTYEVIARKR